MTFINIKLVAIFSLIIFTFAVFYFILFDHPLSPSDKRYERYGKERPSSLPVGSTLLTRENVVKDLWFASDERRKHIHVETPLSHLKYVSFNEKFDLIEYMEDPNIYVEESQNEARNIIANQGVFSYLSFSLNCNDANISFYTQKNGNNRLASMKKYFEGTAKQVSIGVNDHEPLIKADGLSAQFTLPTEIDQKAGDCL